MANQPMYPLTCSIVLYNNNLHKLIQTVTSVLNSNVACYLYLIDNSQTDKLKHDLSDLIANKNVEYIFNNKNIGYGKAHNAAIRKSDGLSDFHLVLNPDVTFENEVLPELLGYMQSHDNIGQVLPKVYYEDGGLQKLCHLLPKPVDLIGRRFFLSSAYMQKQNYEYELKDFDYSMPANIPNLSGCFMLLRRAALKRAGLFDERYFMYLEDIDLTRRIHKHFATMYYPYVSIIHGFEKESYHNFKLLSYHMASAIKYFFKWGWFFDSERNKVNRDALQNLQVSSLITQTVN